MFRVAITAYLLVATIAGPLWCCCTVANAAIFSVGASEKSEKEDGARCCSTKSHEKEQSNRSQDQPSKDQSPCPCSEMKAVQPATVDSADSVKIAFGHCDCPLFIRPEPIDSFQRFAKGYVPPLPLTGQEIRLAIQVFLC